MIFSLNLVAVEGFDLIDAGKQLYYFIFLFGVLFFSPLSAVEEFTPLFFIFYLELLRFFSASCKILKIRSYFEVLVSPKNEGGFKFIFFTAE